MEQAKAQERIAVAQTELAQIEQVMSHWENEERFTQKSIDHFQNYATQVREQRVRLERRRAELDAEVRFRSEQVQELESGPPNSGQETPNGASDEQTDQKVLSLAAHQS